MIDEDSPHRLGRGRVEVPAAGPGNLSRPDELEIGFVDEGRGRQRVVITLAAHPLMGGATQLVVDKRQELLRCCDVAIGGSVHEERHIGMTVRRGHPDIIIGV